MSDQHTLTRLPSPTLYDLIGISDETSLACSDDVPLAYKQNTSPFEPPNTETSSGTEKEDNAIKFMLENGSSPEQIVLYVQTRKKSKEAGNHEALDIISGVQTEQLPARIHNVETRLCSTFAKSSSVLLPATALVSRTVPLPVSLKREFSEGLDEDPGALSQDIKRPRTVSRERESKPTKTRKSSRPQRRGCPGNDWECEPRDLERRKTWTSFKKFSEHYRLSHLTLPNEHQHGSGLKCLLCDDSTFSGEGYALVKHIWDTHLV